MINLDAQNILVTGGSTNNPKSIASCEVFNIEQQAWIPSMPSLNYARQFHSMCKDKKSVYVIGGLSFYGAVSSSFERIDISRLLQTVRPIVGRIEWDFIVTEDQFTPRKMPIVFCVSQNVLIILGGRDNNEKYLECVIKFDTKKVKAVQVATCEPCCADFWNFPGAVSKDKFIAPV